MSSNSRHRPALLLALLGLTGLVGLVGCTEESREPVDSRIVILGFDGMDPVLAHRWMDSGDLPNFSRLAAEGSFSPLATSNPPQSPVAWSDFATGLNPGQHGIYDFLRRDPETYAPAFSISEVRPPEHVVEAFGLAVPLDSGEIVNRRQGTPFWSALEDGGAWTTTLRVPVTYPPDPVHRMLSGMGVPDLLGTQGTYTLFTTRPTVSAATSSSTRAVRVRPDRSGRIETRFEGPAHPLKAGAEAMSVPLVIEPDGERVAVTLGEQRVSLAVGEWSTFLDVSFEYLGFASVPGIVRLHLVEGYPRLQLYVSPIQIDPRNPVVPISSPSDYAATLAEDIGLYHTIGMPEETWSLNEGHLSDAAFLDMERTLLAEREAMFYQALEARDSEVVTGVFVQTDRVSHMFYRGLDPEHPLHDETDAEARDAIRWIYTEADRILGETLSRLGPEDRLLVISDHGFAPFRWAAHLNSWLAENDYLVLQPGQAQSGIGFAQVDWSKTRAYAVGLNGLFLNRAGREAQGIVADHDVAALKASLTADLEAWTEPDTAGDIVRTVFDGAEIYDGNANGDAPDLVIGYQPGVRASWQTTLGAVPLLTIEPNDRKWSGDHCMAPDAVPGVLFTSFGGDHGIDGIGDIAAWVRANTPSR